MLDKNNAGPVVLESRLNPGLYQMLLLASTVLADMVTFPFALIMPNLATRTVVTPLGDPLICTVLLDVVKLPEIKLTGTTETFDTLPNTIAFADIAELLTNFWVM